MGPEDFTPREHDVISLACDGMTTKQIASRLHLSLFTIRTVQTNIRNKLGVHSMTHAAVIYVQWRHEQGHTHSPRL